MDELSFKRETDTDNSDGVVPCYDILIVGGGFSGTTLAVQLSRRDPELKVAIVDSGKIPGQGLAYGTNYQCHVLNVPAKSMSAFPEDPEHFVRWARRHHDLLETAAALGRGLIRLLRRCRAHIGKRKPTDAASKCSHESY